jgi:hypothetical protein
MSAMLAIEGSGVGFGWYILIAASHGAEDCRRRMCETADINVFISKYYLGWQGLEELPWTGKWCRINLLSGKQKSERGVVKRQLNMQ